jgi:RNA polymerase sigma factor (sigma-70 family)
VTYESPLAAAIERHHLRLRRTLGRAGLLAHDVDDVAQDVLAIFCRRFADIPEPAQWAFLQQTARRVVSDHRNLKWNRAVFAALDPELVDGRSRSPSEHVEQKQLGQLVADALCVLPFPEKQVFVLIHHERHSRTQVAERLGIPAGTVASRLRRANHLFADALARMSQPLGTGDLGLDATRPWLAPGRTPGCIALPTRSRALVGEQLYCDEQWGRGRCPGPYDQCLLSRPHDGGTQLGWTWNWSGHAEQGYALPEIVVGWKPWLGGRPTDPRFPVALRGIRHLHVDFDVELRAQGTYNLLLNLWFVRELPRDLHAAHELISAELMVDLDYSEDVPRQHFVETVELDGVAHDLWLGHESQGSRLEPWPSITVVRTRRTTRGSVDLGALLERLVQQGQLDAGDYLASVELGNVVYGGEGQTWVNTFRVALDASGNDAAR